MYTRAGDFKTSESDFAMDINCNIYLECKDIVPYRVECISGDNLGFMFGTVYRYTDHLHFNLGTGCVVGTHVLTGYHL